MKNRKFIAIGGILLILATLVGYKTIKQRPRDSIAPLSNDNIHYHAGFVVFEDGKKVDFSDQKYMHIEACEVEGTEKAEEETLEHEQIEKAHLHDFVGDVVHTHRKGAKWSDLFININYPLDYSQTKSFINGEEVEDVKNIPIKAYDSVVIFVGEVDKSKLSEAVTIGHIKEVEAKSENCGE